MNQTTNYQLNQWDPDDKVLRSDFNADNAKIDEALAALAVRAGALEDITAHLANCMLWTTSFIGQGSSCAERRIEFPWLPLVVIIMGGDGYTMITTPEQQTIFVNPSSVYSFRSTWEGNTLSWPIERHGSDRMNELGVTYRVVALGLSTSA